MFSLRALTLGLVVAIFTLSCLVPQADAQTAAKAKKCKKGYVKKKVKGKTKCVKKKKAKPRYKTVIEKVTVPATPISDPNSDADGDGLPKKWEVPAPQPTVVTRKKRVLIKKAKKCKKGYVKKKVKGKTKCVKKKKRKAKTSVFSTRAVGDGSLAAYGANPNRKDIFVQFAYASQAVKDSMPCEQFDVLYNAFANAPVANPDGSTGINLHLDAGKTCPSRKYDLGGSGFYSLGACPTFNQVLNEIAQRLPESRIRAFHVAGFSPTCGNGGEGGQADLNGTQISVFTEGDGFAMTFMHELGHNLGLNHGPTRIPNRLSVMNGRVYASPNGNSSSTVEVVDYQRFALPALDESALSESAGLGITGAPPYYITHECPGATSAHSDWVGYPSQLGAVDWNCSTSFPMLPNQTTDIQAGTIASDLDDDGNTTDVYPATPNEWNVVDYKAGGKIGP